jgi:hypothetical protein
MELFTEFHVSSSYLGVFQVENVSLIIKSADESMTILPEIKNEARYFLHSESERKCMCKPQKSREARGVADTSMSVHGSDLAATVFFHEGRVKRTDRGDPSGHRLGGARVRSSPRATLETHFSGNCYKIILEEIGFQAH